jgi:RimJ/RimL family protein N-acetyltransferase
MVDIPTLYTERLLLRAIHPEDAEAYLEMNADREFARFLTADGGPISAEDAWRQMAMLVGHWQLRGFGMWVVAERERPDRLIGRVGPHQPHGWPDFEIGWAIARPYWGRGYATEAGREAVRYAFQELDRPRIVSLIHPDNLASAAVARRLGERRVGDWVLRGQRVDLYALDRSEWTD